VNTLCFVPNILNVDSAKSIVYNRIQQREDLRERVIIGWLREEEWGISSWLDLVVRIFRSIGEEYPDTEVSSIAINNITTLQNH
jgi:hypothetical protein